eukprot:gnl/TRDRNA2_/TRDRNA2_152892_c1_seq2.p1 gnl/TRDRNA2_/TRDRNA2_152892_c1~~gnl/TRDRNA2_/TRDRNA2_152892_c1_seq2.p1  ORF type:complete len:176 (-),score=47.83 gnl/TRDRNA2_/TRDRNA2_152892_c1_seq2:78-539(-)
MQSAGAALLAAAARLFAAAAVDKLAGLAPSVEKLASLLNGGKLSPDGTMAALRAARHYASAALAAEASVEPKLAVAVVARGGDRAEGVVDAAERALAAIMGAKDGGESQVQKAAKELVGRLDDKSKKVVGEFMTSHIQALVHHSAASDFEWDF